MIIGKYKKQPGETLDYDIDYTGFVPAGDSISAASAVSDDASLSVDAVEFDPVTSIVKVWLSGGTDGLKYKVTVTVTTAVGRIKEDEIVIRVVEM